MECFGRNTQRDGAEQGQTQHSHSEHRHGNHFQLHDHPSRPGLRHEDFGRVSGHRNRTISGYILSPPQRPLSLQ